MRAGKNVRLMSVTLTMVGSVVAFVAGCGSPNASSNASSTPSASVSSGSSASTVLVGDAVAGQQLFQKNCVSCHSSGVSAAQADDAIQNGTSDGMAALSNITAKQRADIVAYLKKAGN